MLDARSFATCRYTDTVVIIRSPLLELANYHVLGRVLLYIPYFAPIAPGRVLSTFGLLLFVVETLNALGVALASNPAGSSQGVGSSMIIAALGMQLVVILVFIGLAGTFHRRIVRARIETKPVRTVLIVMYCSMALILIRCIYRLVEHLGNTTIRLDDPASLEALGPALRYEWYFYIFESSTMFLNSLVWNVLSAGRLLPRDSRTYLRRDGMTELVDDHKDDRSTRAKIIAIMLLRLLAVYTAVVRTGILRKFSKARCHAFKGLEDKLSILVAVELATFCTLMQLLSTVVPTLILIEP